MPRRQVGPIARSDREGTLYNSPMKSAPALLAFLFMVSFATSQTMPANSATVPITLDHNRIIIDVYLPMRDGSKTRVRGWVDPGDTEMSISEALSKKLGLTIVGGNPDAKKSQVPAELLVGAMKIDLGAIKEARALMEESIAPGTSASIKLPATVLRNYDLIIDYLNREFTIATPGAVHWEGTATQASIGQSTGLIQLDCKLAGGRHTVSFDPGSSVSWLSGELISKWHKIHPRWPSMVGAIGPANLWGSEAEPGWRLLRIPEIECGNVAFTNGVAVPLSEDAFDWFQKRAGVPTIGLIGADVLLNFRVGIDYGQARVYFKQLSKYTPPGIDAVGVILRPDDNRRYTVIGVADHEGKPSVPEIKKGDTLLTVDNARVSGGTMGQVWSLLSGSPGDMRTLGLERDGKPLTVKATVYRFLPSVTEELKAKKH